MNITSYTKNKGHSAQQYDKYIQSVISFRNYNVPTQKYEVLFYITRAQNLNRASFFAMTSECWVVSFVLFDS
eukprot:UN09554